uniref:Uncharacterized protein n=1 Tax=Triticum urartu TaxID=4572 RepID=A0A8R7QDX4_TRIUA
MPPFKICSAAPSLSLFAFPSELSFFLGILAKGVTAGETFAVLSFTSFGCSNSAFLGPAALLRRAKGFGVDASSKLPPFCTILAGWIAWSAGEWFVLAGFKQTPTVPAVLASFNILSCKM